MASSSLKNSEMTRVAEKWNTFLLDLGAKLSLYEIQKDRENYNVADIKYWGTSGKQQKMEITKDTFVLFLKKTAQYNLAEYDSIRNIVITESQLQELNHILSLTLKTKVTKSCSIPNELVIKGDYIKFSDFIKTDGNLNLNVGCGNITDVRIFALNTVFVDRDVMLNGTKINLGIISPKWEIISTRKIELSGADGDSEKIAVKDRKNNGAAGESGSPGKAGGNFFGIGAEFINGNDLAIISNGGRGGAGGNGEDGETGVHSDHTIKLDPQLPCNSTTPCKDLNFIDLNGKAWFCEMFDHNAISTGFLNLSINTQCSFRVQNLQGGEGKNGGNGGKGGRGGNSGNIVLLELNEHSRIWRYKQTGKNGRDGRGGTGGDGGIDGERFFMHFNDYNRGPKWRVMNDIRKNIKQKRGQNGIDGANEEGLRDPEKADFPKPAKILRKYKSYLRDNLNDRFKNHPLMEFLRQLDNNGNVKSIYDTLELFNELKDLGQQFYNFNNDADLIALYQSLLDRISEYAQNPKDIENSNQYKKILIYLYVAILGQVSFLEDQSQSNLIIDIDNHLDWIKKDIESMSNLQKAIDKADLINEYKENNKRDVKRQIDEAQSVIEQQITPKINEISMQMDNQMALLITEIRTMKKAVKVKKRNGNVKGERSEEIMEGPPKSKNPQLIDKREELAETTEKLAVDQERELILKKKQLENVIILRALCGGLEIIGKAVNVFGPIGSAAQSLIESMNGAIEFSITDDGSSEQERLRSKIEFFADEIEVAKNKQVDNLNGLLEVIYEKMAVDPENFNHLPVKIGHMRTKLWRNTGYKFSLVEGLEVELKHLLEQKEKELTGSTESAKNDEKTARAIAVLRKINQAVKIYTLGFDIDTKCVTEANLNAISGAIRHTKNIEKLQQNKKNIYNITIPMLQKIEDTFRGVVSEIDKKSGMSLDVTKWQVQSVLKDMKLVMKKLTQMIPDVQDDLLNCVAMLEDTIATFINIFDRIQSYEREQKFVNCYADMSLITGSNVQITDSRLSEVINLDILEEFIRSNYVIIKHKVAIEAFKNFVFPLAHVYLRNSKLPLHLQLDNSLENSLLKATTQIQYIQKRAAIHKTYLSGTGYNQNIILGSFTSFYTSTDPFFVWKNSENKDLIEKLLRSQKVKIRANVVDSPTFKDAIKFSLAVFYFKAQNETMQNEINNLLKGFEIQATHLGDSYYRCNDKYYRITGEATEISYYLEKKPNGQPMSMNPTYIGLKAKHSILSPYATWEVILMSSTNRVTYHDLQKYKDVVDLELIGDGSYIDNRRVDYSRLTVGKYYQGIEMSNRLEGHPKSETIEGGDSTLNRRNARSIDRPKDNPISSSVESSLPISSFGSYLNQKLSTLKNPGAVEKIKGWLGGEVSQRDEETSVDFPYDDDLFDFNRNTAFSYLPGGSRMENSSNGFIDSENPSPGFVNYVSLETHGNLLLLDMVFRKKNSTKYKNEDNVIKNNLDTEYAQNHAYSAHAP